MSQWLVGPLLGTEETTRNHIVLSKDPTSDCYMRLTPDFFSFPKRQIAKGPDGNTGI